MKKIYILFITFQSILVSQNLFDSTVTKEKPGKNLNKVELKGDTLYVKGIVAENSGSTFDYSFNIKDMNKKFSENGQPIVLGDTKPIAVYAATKEGKDGIYLVYENFVVENFDAGGNRSNIRSVKINGDSPIIINGGGAPIILPNGTGVFISREGIMIFLPKNKSFNETFRSLFEGLKNELSANFTENWKINNPQLSIGDKEGMIFLRDMSGIIKYKDGKLLKIVFTEAGEKIEIELKWD